MMKSRRFQRASRILGATAFACLSLVATDRGVHAATSCTFTRGTDFSTLSELQTILTNGGGGGCTATADGDSLTIDFNTAGTITVTTTLTWSHAADLTLRGGATLDGQSARRVFSSSDGNERVTIDSLIVENGRATSQSGGAVSVAGTLSITDSTFRNNQLTGFNTGGAVFCTCIAGLTISGSTFSDNSAYMNGGAVGTASAPITIASSTFTGNHATQYHGGAVIGGAATISNSTFAENIANGDAGAVSASGTTTITDSTFHNNQSGGTGGGMYSFQVAITGSTFTGNTAARGGGAHIQGGTISDSAFSSNTATDSGAGVYHTGNYALTLNSVTVNGNTAGANGGGVWLGQDSDFTVVNSTIVSNIAGASTTGTGGGIYADAYTWNGNDYGADDIKVYFSTVASNQSRSGGANIGNADVVTATYEFFGSVISDPQPTSNVNPTPSVSNCPVVGTAVDSVASDSSCFASGGSNRVATVSDINLGALSNNGGTTQTMRPGTGSVLIEHVAQASYSGNDRDQTGTTRTMPTTAGAVHVAATNEVTPESPASSTTTASAVVTTTTMKKATTATLPDTGSRTSNVVYGAAFLLAFGLLILSRRRFLRGL